MLSVQFYRDVRLPFFELKMFDCGEVSYKRHSHEEYSLGLVETGESILGLRGATRIRVGPNMLISIPPGLVHVCNPQRPAFWRYQMLFLNPVWLEQSLEAVVSTKCLQAIIASSVRLADYSAVRQLLAVIRAPVMPLEKETRLLTTMKALFRLQCKRLPPFSMAKTEVQIIRDYLQANYLEKITLDELALLSGLDKYYIVRAFQAAYQVPPHTYQTLLRINWVKRELRNAMQASLADIACAAGFYDQSHFCKVFKSQTGVTPEQYRNLNNL